MPYSWDNWNLDPLFGIQVEATNRGINQVTKKLEPQVLYGKAKASLQDCLDLLKEAVVRRTPYATGETSEGIFTQINGNTLDDLNGIVASPDAHFINLEYGRRAGARMPPSAPIEEWAAAKGIERSAVFPIRRAIAARGIPALHIMQRAIEEQKPKFAIVWFKRFLADWGRGGY